MFKFEMTIEHKKHGEIDVVVEGHQTSEAYAGSYWQPPEPAEFEIDDIFIDVDKDDPLYGCKIPYEELSKEDKDKLNELAYDAMIEAAEDARTEYLIDRYEDEKYWRY